MKLKGPTRCFEACLLRTLYETAEAFPRAERDDRYGGPHRQAAGRPEIKSVVFDDCARGTSTVPSENT